MPAQVTNYKCPTCTGPLHFVGASGKLECDYCGASYDVAQIEALLRGNTCGPRSTSCADQLAVAVQQAYEQEQAQK